MFNTIENTLNAKYINRRKEIRGLILSVIANENIVFLGPAGTAKTAIGEDFCRLLGLRCFSHLMTRFSVPEELFGPLSLTKLKEDKYVRVILGTLIDSDIAMLDEVFKSNSAILNSLLNAMNERVYRENGVTRRIPLKTLIGMSNELPESAELNAFFDRFMLRYNVSYLNMDEKKELMRSRRHSLPELIPVQFDPEVEIEKARKTVDSIEFSDNMIDTYISVCSALKSDHGIEVSDRRDVKIMNIMKANAFMEGRTSVNDEDLSVLENVLWRAPEERGTVSTTIIKVAAPLQMELQQLLDSSYEVYQKMNAPTLKGLDAVKLQSELAALNSEMKAIHATAQKKIEGRVTPRIQEYMDKISDYRKKGVKRVIENVEA